MTVTTEQLNAFCAAVDVKVAAYYVTAGYTFEPEITRVEMGKKYARIVQHKKGEKLGSAFCFVELSTGDIFKPAGYKAPAKHARGNIANGAADVGPYGPAYLR